jgi:hypothetical protein
MQHINAVLFLEERFVVQTSTDKFWAKSGQKRMLIFFPKSFCCGIIIL